MKVPLDWVGFHYYTRRIVSDASGGASSGSTATSVLRPKEKAARPRSAYSDSCRDADRRAAHRSRPGDMAARHLRPGDADLAMSTTTPSSRSARTAAAISIVQTTAAAFPTRAGFLFIVRYSPSSPALSPTEPRSAPITPGAWSITSNGRMATRSGMASLTWIFAARNAPSKTQDYGTDASPLLIA